VATVTILSERFAPLGRSLAQRAGLPDLPIVVVPHPVGAASPEAVEAKGLDVADLVGDALIRQPGP
jgi:hypothetical protein